MGVQVIERAELCDTARAATREYDRVVRFMHSHPDVDIAMWMFIDFSRWGAAVDSAGD